MLNITYEYDTCIQHFFCFLSVTTMTMIYRPVETESVKEELFSIANNPSPVLEILNNMYAMNANGTVRIWVQDERELITMKEVLKVYRNINTFAMVNINRLNMKDMSLLLFIKYKALSDVSIFITLVVYLQIGLPHESW